jgi:hypothetical protein
MTRNYILPNNGKVMMICIPVNEKSSNYSIDEIRLSINGKWKQSFIRTIYFSYKKAPFFDETFPIIESILKKDFVTLHEFNSQSILQICNHLNMKTVISTNHEAYRGMESEIQEKYSKGINEAYDNVLERKTMRIISICKKEQASTYHNTINGENLYRHSDFIPYDINLKFIEPNPIDYKQFNGCFCPNLSIIDVLMHCGKNKTQYLLDNYKII